MKKLLSVTLCILLIFSSCAGPGPSDNNPSGTENTASEDVLSHISLPMIPVDSFNPYTAKSSINISLIPLIYSGLTVTLSDFTAEMCLAESVTRISDTSCLVTLKKGVLFSDGSDITPADVVFSFNSLKSSGGYFSEKLSAVTGASVKDGGILFTLSSPDRYFVNNLDFPVTKAAAGTKNPIGGGRYNLKEKDGKYTLVPNRAYFGKQSYTFDSITLVPIQYNDSLYNAIKSGLVDFLPADLSLGNYLGMSAKEKSVPTGNFLYLGVGGNKLSDPALRAVISRCINRSMPGDNIPVSDITPSSLPLHPNIPEVFALDRNTVTADVETVKDELEINLLYSSDSTEKSDIADNIKKYIEKTGIKVNLVGKGYNDYKNMLSSGNFDLYLGEVKLCDSLSLWPLINGYAFSLNVSPELKTAYYNFGTGALSAEDFLTAFEKELPFIPLGYKNSAFAYTKSVSFPMVCAVSDCYYSIQNAK